MPEEEKEPFGKELRFLFFLLPTPCMSWASATSLLPSPSFYDPTRKNARKRKAIAIHGSAASLSYRA